MVDIATSMIAFALHIEMKANKEIAATMGDQSLVPRCGISLTWSFDFWIFDNSND